VANSLAVGWDVSILLLTPPGPLGVVIETTVDGSVIHSMKTNSPLINLVHIGDVVVSIDDIDTRSMTAATDNPAQHGSLNFSKDVLALGNIICGK